ncbi:hypothetical protein L6452_27958 [Arctium lappa]|uniref:Uncharacterized protein n=1 Tax=Arctium lappa TaxID=4217 RepID=A0ACB8ZWZ9_ARCLA|nr:hypothetical protein L6452_27958 [Arctium lappa]
MVRSIVGHDYLKMNVVRALHMANNDATAAINIIFDTPSFKRSEALKSPKVSSRNETTKTQDTVRNSKRNGVSCTVADEPSLSRPVELTVDKGKEVIKAGDQVNFTFPPEKCLSGPSPGRFGGGGRGRFRDREVFYISLWGDFLKTHSSPLTKFDLLISIFARFLHRQFFSVDTSSKAIHTLIFGRPVDGLEKENVIVEY